MTLSAVHPAEEYTPCRDLWVITTYFNPAGHQTQRCNFDLFAAPIRRAGIPLVVVECAFGDRPFELEPGPYDIQVRTRDVLWLKERLVNLAIAQLPRAAEKVMRPEATFLGRAAHSFPGLAWAAEPREDG